MMREKLSYREAARQFEIKDHDRVRYWERIYLEEGPKGLYIERRGRGYFKYPQEVRRLIYTTNAIEGFNRQLRKVAKAKSVFPSDDSLLKMLYPAMMDIRKK